MQIIHNICGISADTQFEFQKTSLELTEKLDKNKSQDGNHFECESIFRQLILFFFFCFLSYIFHFFCFLPILYFFSCQLRFLLSIDAISNYYYSNNKILIWLYLDLQLWIPFSPNIMLHLISRTFAASIVRPSFSLVWSSTIFQSGCSYCMEIIR